MAESTITNSTLTMSQVQRLLIQPLSQRSTFLSIGFPEFTSSGESIRLPSLSTMGTPTFVAQGSSIPEVSASTSEVVLLDTSLYSIKTLTRISNELVSSAVINVESAFSIKMTADAARIVDSALWAGSGTAGAPTGLINYTGMTNAGTAGTVTASHLYTMQEYSAAAYADPTTVVWAMSPKNFTRVRKFEDTSGRNIFQPSLAAGAPSTLLGVPYVITTHLPDTSIYLIDRNQVAVGMDMGRAEITVDRSRYLDTDETAIRVTLRYDAKPMNPAAIVKLTGITA